MAGRIRSIKPEVLDDEVAAGLTDAAWRMWVSSWVLADDHGNLRAAAKYLAANVWQDTSRDAETPLAELIRKGRFQPYAVNGQRYVHVHAWHKHQRVDNASNPRVPTPDKDDGTWDPVVTPILSETRRESPTVSESFGEIPLARRARAQSSGETPTPTPTPITDPPNAPPAAAVGSDEPTSLFAAEVREVFEHWAAKRAALTGAQLSSLKLTKDRRGKIQARLREKYAVADLKLAVDGMFATPFNVERHFTDVELACRDGSHVDRYVATAKQLHTNGAHVASRSSGTAGHVVNGQIIRYDEPTDE